LSVKIRSNDEIDNYTEDMLIKERRRLRRASPIILVEYIQTSIEILMQLKSDEARAKLITNNDK
jgi:hypothetical protein